MARCLRNGIQGNAARCREPHQTINPPTKAMLHWTLVFLVFALVAALLGFGGIAGAAASIAKILFLVFLVLWIISLVVRGGGGRAA